jgi:hypothetical protein
MAPTAIRNRLSPIPMPPGSARIETRTPTIVLQEPSARNAVSRRLRLQEMRPEGDPCEGPPETAPQSQSAEDSRVDSFGHASLPWHASRRLTSPLVSVHPGDPARNPSPTLPDRVLPNRCLLTSPPQRRFGAAADDGLGKLGAEPHSSRKTNGCESSSAPHSSSTFSGDKPRQAPPVRRHSTERA